MTRSAERFAVAHVTPSPWGAGDDVDRAVRATTAGLAARGHRVTVICPSTSHADVRAGRAAIRAGDVLGAPGEVRVLAVGEALALPGASRARATLPIDLARTVEELCALEAFDLCHLHEPYSPSISSAVLRHSRALNVGTFHAPGERLLATQVTRRLADVVLGRLDARLASSGATARRAQRFLGGEYRVLPPGADPVGATVDRDDPARPVRIAVLDAEERGALRTTLRGLRRLEATGAWEVELRPRRPGSQAVPVVRGELADRVRVTEDPEEAVLARADVVVLASDGAAPAPDLVARVLAAGAIPLASGIDAYQDALDEGRLGLLHTPNAVDELATQLGRLVDDPALRGRLREAGARATAARPWATVAEELEGVYEALAVRRHPAEGDPVLARRVGARRRIDVDLHMHTDHSGDCATPVEVLLATARDEGLGAIAVTDHNVISGAEEAAALAERYGVKVIVGEEVKTATQGEVIGLFLHEQIPRGLTMRETVDAIKAQGGVVYVPHPFDRMHAVPDYEHLLPIVEDVDALEVFNPRVAIGSFNEEAVRFAAKYRIVAGAGSDSHVAAGLGTVRVRMPDFDGPEEFLAALRQAELITRPGTLLYVQALKFLETKATPEGARSRRRDRRVRRARAGRDRNA